MSAGAKDGARAARPGRPTTDAATSARMSRQRTRDTKPEVELRTLLHRAGLRYYVDRAPLRSLRRKADVVFPRLRIAVYVDGCFWHSCPEHATHPRNNAQWWADKLAGNVTRDRDTDRKLIEAGWTVVRIWEHTDAEDAAAEVLAAVDAARSGSIASREAATTPGAVDGSTQQ